jgi:hypothetical protein
MDEIMEETMTKFMDKMASENQPFAVKDYLSKIQFHIIYNLCLGAKYVLPNVWYMYLLSSLLYVYFQNAYDSGFI